MRQWNSPFPESPPRIGVTNSTLGTFSCYKSERNRDEDKPRAGLILLRSRSLQLRLYFSEQPRQLDGLGVKVIAAGGARFLLITAHRMGGQRDDGNAPRGFVRFELARSFP